MTNLKSPENRTNKIAPPSVQPPEALYEVKRFWKHVSQPFLVTQLAVQTCLF